MKFTQKVADILELPLGKTSVIRWDHDVSGLGHRIQRQKKTWIIRYRPAGDKRQRQITLGSVATMPLKKARQLAGQYLVAARQGRDLATEHKESAEAVRSEQAVNENCKVGIIAARYLNEVEQRLKPIVFLIIRDSLPRLC